MQERVAAELDGLGLLAKPGNFKPRPLELDDLKGLKYLTAVNKESMRMYPAVPLIGRWVGYGARAERACDVSD